MSVSIMTQVWKMDLPTTDKMVLLALADAANDDGVTWIAVKHRNPDNTKLDLMKKCSLSERAVQGSLKRLVEGDHLKRRDILGKGVIWTVTPAADAPRSTCTPADDDAYPRSTCTQTVSNRQLEDKSSITKRARPFPEDWQPTEEDCAYGTAQGLSPEEVNRAVEDFRDYFIAAGPSRKSTNWSLNWKRWCRTTADRAKKGRSGAGVAGRQAPRGGRRENPSFAEIRARRNAGRPDGVEVSGSWSGVQGSDHGWSDGAIDGEATIRMLKD